MAKVEYPLRHYVDSQGKYLGGFAGLAQPPAGATQVDAAPGPTYRQARKDAYARDLGKDPGDYLNTIGDVLDVLIAQVEAMREEAKLARTEAFADMLGKIAAIKSRYPSGG